MTLEEMFVKNCIIPSRQARLLFELQSQKKRNFAISRFAHDTDSLLRKGCVLAKIKPSEFPTDFLGEDVWAIFMYDSGGKYLNGYESMQMINNAYGPIIIVSKKRCAVIKNENNTLYLLTFDQKKD